MKKTPYCLCPFNGHFLGQSAIFIRPNALSPKQYSEIFNIFKFSSFDY